MPALCNLVNRISNAIIDPFLALIFGVGLVVFVWGVVQYMIGLSGGGGAENQEKGKRHMIYGILGMAIMLSAWAIIQLIANTIGVGVQSC